MIDGSAASLPAGVFEANVAAVYTRKRQAPSTSPNPKRTCTGKTGRQARTTREEGNLHGGTGHLHTLAPRRPSSRWPAQ